MTGTRENASYYYKNTSGEILSPTGREYVRNLIRSSSLKCSFCGVDLFLISYNDGDCICCPVDVYGHPSKWYVFKAIDGGVPAIKMFESR